MKTLYSIGACCKILAQTILVDLTLKACLYHIYTTTCFTLLLLLLIAFVPNEQKARLPTIDKGDWTVFIRLVQPCVWRFVRHAGLRETHIVCWEFAFGRKAWPSWLAQLGCGVLIGLSTCRLYAFAWEVTESPCLCGERFEVCLDKQTFTLSCETFAWPVAFVFTSKSFSLLEWTFGFPLWPALLRAHYFDVVVMWNS